VNHTLSNYTEAVCLLAMQVRYEIHFPEGKKNEVAMFSLAAFN
jgi:hypothetical protein